MTHSSGVPEVCSVVPVTGLPAPPMAVHHPQSRPGDQHQHRGHDDHQGDHQRRRPDVAPADAPHERDRRASDPAR